MRDRRRFRAFALAFSLAASAGFAQQPPTVEEELEVREVGVVADLPERLRGFSAVELAERLAVLEDGVSRQPVHVDGLAGAGSTYGRVLVVVDRQRCSAEILAAATSALGSEAERLVGLGPVEVAELGERLEARGEPGRSPEAVATLLAEMGRGPCGEAPAPERMARVDLVPADLTCARTPCLMVWIGPGWGGAPEGGAARPVSSSEIDPLARRLAGAGWLFLAAPIVPADPAAAKPTVPDAESRPGSDRHTFGINVLDRSGARKPLTPAEYDRFVDVWRAPLRRLVGATAGELADRPEELARALARLADRSILWYRTDRPRSAEPPTIEVREAGRSGRRYRAPEWAPASGR